MLDDSERVDLLALLPKEAKQFLDQVSVEVHANYEAFRAKRREIGLKTDPDTAEIKSFFVNLDFDPYGSGFDFSFGCYGGGGFRLFAQEPGTKTWVFEEDLPETIVERIRAKHSTPPTP
jgi:hypothetical protein